MYCYIGQIVSYGQKKKKTVIMNSVGGRSTFITRSTLCNVIQHHAHFNGFDKFLHFHSFSKRGSAENEKSEEWCELVNLTKHPSTERTQEEK